MENTVRYSSSSWLNIGINVKGNIRDIMVVVRDPGLFVKNVELFKLFPQNSSISKVLPRHLV